MKDFIVGLEKKFELHPSLLLAVHFAANKHGNQMYGDKPYLFHIKQVLVETAKYTSDERTLRLAILHDTVEDTDATLDEIMRTFDVETAAMVDKITDQPGKNRFERHLNTYWRIRIDKRCVLVKLADRIANWRHALDNSNIGLAQMYLKEYNNFKFALYDCDSYAKPMWDTLDELNERAKTLSH